MSDLWIVSSHFREDLSWLKRCRHKVVVVSKKPDAIDKCDFGEVHSVPNKGNEFGSYIWFICNYYDRLPDRVAFIHGHETSYHQSLPMMDAIEGSKDSDCFFSLNGNRCAAYHYFFRDSSHFFLGKDYKKLWDLTGMNRFGVMPNQFVFPNGTQTIVSRDLIRSNSLSFYREILDAIVGQPGDLSLFLESVWHVILGQNFVMRDFFDLDMHFYCLRTKSSVLIHGHNLIWSSCMPNVAYFGEHNSEEEWKSRCLEVLSLFS